MRSRQARMLKAKATSPKVLTQRGPLTGGATVIMCGACRKQDGYTIAVESGTNALVAQCRACGIIYEVGAQTLTAVRRVA